MIRLFSGVILSAWFGNTQGYFMLTPNAFVEYCDLRLIEMGGVREHSG
jgi:hypothetical protein